MWHRGPSGRWTWKTMGGSTAQSGTPRKSRLSKHEAPESMAGRARKPETGQLSHPQPQWQRGPLGRLFRYAHSTHGTLPRPPGGEQRGVAPTGDCDGRPGWRTLRLGPHVPDPKLHLLQCECRCFWRCLGLCILTNSQVMTKIASPRTAWGLWAMQDWDPQLRPTEFKLEL